MWYPVRYHPRLAGIPSASRLQRALRLRSTRVNGRKAPLIWSMKNSPSVIARKHNGVPASPSWLRSLESSLVRFAFSLPAIIYRQPAPNMDFFSLSTVIRTATGSLIDRKRGRVMAKNRVRTGAAWLYLERRNISGEWETPSLSRWRT